MRSLDIGVALAAFVVGVILALPIGAALRFDAEPAQSETLPPSEIRGPVLPPVAPIPIPEFCGLHGPLP